MAKRTMTCATCGRPSACRTLVYVGRRGPNFAQPFSGYADSPPDSEDRPPRSKPPLADVHPENGIKRSRPEGTEPDRSPSRTGLVPVAQGKVTCAQGVNPGLLLGVR